MGTAKNGWAVVTGASSGLGADFARQLAADAHDVVLAARRRDRLEALAAELRTKSGVEVLVVPGDLGAPGGAAALVSALDAHGVVPSVLVNNAGYGAHGLAIEQPLARQLEMIDLNVRALTELAITVGARMARRGAGSIINVGSTGSFQPTPYVATYAATKAYVLSFSQALAWELAPRGVHVLALCPGATRTEFFDAAQMRVQLPDAVFMSSERCVRLALRAMRARRRVLVTGWMNALGAWLGRVMPQWIVVPVSAFTMRPSSRPALPPAG
jgi:short-subunit dehydrogenase